MRLLCMVCGAVGIIYHGAERKYYMLVLSVSSFGMRASCCERLFIWIMNIYGEVKSAVIK